MDISNIKLDKNEIRRYSGYKDKKIIIDSLEEKIDTLIEEVKKTARVKYVYEIYDVNIKDDKIEFANIIISSKSLAKNLDNCEKVIMLAITLGSEIDMLIRRYCPIDSTAMIFVQSISAELLEKCIDEIEKEIIKNYGETIYLKPRFSPGYSDLSINHQKDFVTILNTPKKIGLSTTNNTMLTPTKSVTAIIGITKQNFRAKNKCANCSSNQCEFRK